MKILFKFELKGKFMIKYRDKKNSNAISESNVFTTYYDQAFYLRKEQKLIDKETYENNLLEVEMQFLN